MQLIPIKIINSNLNLSRVDLQMKTSESKLDSSNPQVFGYLKFFQVVSELENQKLITSEQKQMLKANYIAKETSLVNFLTIHSSNQFILILLSGSDDIIKQQLISYAKNRQLLSSPSMPHTRIKQSNEQVNCQIESLNQALLQLIEQNEVISPELQMKIASLQEFLFNFTNTCQIFNHKEIKNSMKQNYKQLKAKVLEYMHSMLLIMEEDITYKKLFGLVKHLLKNLIDCEEFSFLIIKQEFLEIYQTSTDTFETLSIENSLQEDLNDIQFGKVIQLTMMFIYPTLCKLISNFNYHRSYLIKTRYNNQTILFIFHQKQFSDDSPIQNILKLTNEYKFCEEVENLGQFLFETIKQAKIQYFKYIHPNNQIISPLQIGDMIQDIGLAFLGCSKYLLIESFLVLLKPFFNITKLKKKRSFEDKSDKSPDLNKNCVYLQIKNQPPLSIQFNNLNLMIRNDMLIFNEVFYSQVLITQFSSLLERYSRFIKQCFDKQAFYKYFLRSKDALLIEFDKKGSLMFLSKSIPAKIKSEYDFELEQEGQILYNTLFKRNPDLIQHIESVLQGDHKYQIKKFLDDYKTDSSYEIFVKKEEKRFKGFAIIFQENQQAWVKNQQKILSKEKDKGCALNLNSDIQKKIRKSLIEHETMNYITQLEENNPDIKNSVISMYLPKEETQISNIATNSNLIFRKLELQKKHPLQISQTPKLITPLGLSAKFNQIGYLTPQEFYSKPNDTILNSFQFSILNVTEKIEKQRIIWALLDINGFINHYRIPLDKLANFLIALEAKYNQIGNPFHNYDHGIQIMQSTHFFSSKVDKIDKFTRFCLLMSGLCHDVNHRGKTNMFEINSFSNLAIRYHDKSVLEQHHAAQSMKLLRKSQNNIFINLTEQDFRNFRKNLIQFILATDMSEHFKLVKEFETRYQEKGDTFGQEIDDTRLLCCMIIHTADFSGGAKEFSISRKWSQKVNQEFMVQFEEEGKLGYPQQPYMKDLEKEEVMAKQEIGFFKVIVRPIYVLLNNYMKGDLKECVNNIDDTIIQWEKILKEIQKQ